MTKLEMKIAQRYSNLSGGRGSTSDILEIGYKIEKGKLDKNRLDEILELDFIRFVQVVSRAIRRGISRR